MGEVFQHIQGSPFTVQYNGGRALLEFTLPTHPHPFYFQFLVSPAADPMEFVSADCVSARRATLDQLAMPQVTTFH